MPDFKFRFSELVGNQLNISLLKRSLSNGTFRQFTIFDGVLGTGKSTCARIAALSLTCEAPQDGEPCCNCASCRANISAMSRGLAASNIRTINAGKLTKREDVDDLIHSIFDMQGSIRNKVFLIEEAHALTKLQSAETALLSELDNIPSNVYVIFSTTRAFDFKDELVSRAEKYSFSRLSDNESRQLLHIASEQRGCVLPDDMTDLIIKYGKGIPRNLLSAMSFLIDENASIEELRAHLQVIDNAKLVRLFESMKSEQIQDYVEVLEDIRSSVASPNIFASIKTFMVQVAFLIEGNIMGTFNSSEKEIMCSLFDREAYYKVVRLISTANQRMSDDDLDMLLLQIRMIIQKRSTADVIVESRKTGATERDRTEEIKAIESRSVASTTEVKKISLDFVRKTQETQG